MNLFANTRAKIIKHLRNHAHRMEKTTRRTDKAKLATNTIGVGGALLAFGGIISIFTPLGAPVTAIIAVGSAVTMASSASTAAVQLTSATAKFRYKHILTDILQEDLRLMSTLSANFKEVLGDLGLDALDLMSDAHSLLSTVYQLGSVGMSLTSDELQKQAGLIGEILHPVAGATRKVMAITDIGVIGKLAKLKIPAVDKLLEGAGELLMETGVLELGATSALEGVFELALNDCAPVSAIIAPYSMFKLIQQFRDYAPADHAKGANILRDLALDMEESGKLIAEKQAKMIGRIRRRAWFDRIGGAIVVSGLVGCFAMLYHGRRRILQ